MRPSTPTLSIFVRDVWAPRARRRLAAKTWERDSIVYEKHIRPTFGERPIAALDVEDLVIWQDRLEEEGVGAPTLIKAMSILSNVFREAARRPRLTGVSGNPVTLLEKPSAKRRRRPQVWGPVVVERVRFELLVHSRRIGQNKELTAQRDALLVSLMEMTGCRPDDVRESVAGLVSTRPYDLGRHTHSALMLASGMSLQRLARIQGHGIRVLDEVYSEQLAEFKDRGERIDPVREIEAARELVWRPHETA